MHQTDDVSGVVLAGGAGRRMQGRDKGMVEWHGRPLVEHVVERLRPQVGQLLISCNRNQEFYRNYADELLGDLRSDYQGPLAGMEAAAGKLSTKFVLVTPCDAPLLPPDLGPRLLAPLRETRAEPIVVSYAFDGERDQYLFAAINVECLHSLTAYLDSGQRTVRGWYQQLPHTSVDFSDQKDCFANLNKLE